jgi:3-dehydroquinate dehydratase I
MTPKVTFHTAKRELTAGPIPRVVGTVSSHLEPRPLEVPTDIVELRLDLIPEDANWAGWCDQLQKAGIPVIGTIRMAAEGGRWNGEELERMASYRELLPHVSAIDVEFRAEIARSLAVEAKAAGKLCIISFHDFQKTPSMTELQEVVREAQHFASIVKVTTMVNTEADLATLESVLQEPLSVPKCVMGMGALGGQTRISFPTRGSCLTYGYLDESNAPGQLSAATLVRELAARIPQYSQQRRAASTHLEV